MVVESLDDLRKLPRSMYPIAITGQMSSGAALGGIYDDPTAVNYLADYVNGGSSSLRSISYETL